MYLVRWVWVWCRGGASVFGEVDVGVVSGRQV